MSELVFPPNFVWGAATSAYQIEGASQADGRGESIWDRFCATPGNVRDSSSGAVACDHYHRYKQDIALLKDLGVGAYRFSIAWPRLFPSGDGTINRAGLDFYNRLVDKLLEASITPYATLYHWDLPQALEERGGWPSRDTAKAFASYADAVARALGDRVKFWVTHNEPWCIATLGYRTGEHAPGRRDLPASLAAAHHLLVSHGLAADAIRANVDSATVGITLNLQPVFPASPSEADQALARELDGEFNRWYLDALYRGHYPCDIVDLYRNRGLVTNLDFVQSGDFDIIGARTDFLGINYYSRAIMRSTSVPDAANLPRTIPAPPPEALTDMGWEVYPEGINELMQRVVRDYAPSAIYITENGAAYPTAPDQQGVIADENRRSYIQAHLEACHRAIEAGVPLRGYFVWSLLDNFEWAMGYEKRFGVVWVDFETQARTIKASGQWYARVARRNALHRESAP